MKIKRIPQLPKKVIKKRAKKIKPVMRLIEDKDGSWIKDPNGSRYIVSGYNIFNYSYIWKPKPLMKIKAVGNVATIITYHETPYPGSFNPSVAEVLAQIPEELLPYVDAFEIDPSPKGYESILDDDHNFTRTYLYKLVK